MTGTPPTAEQINPFDDLDGRVAAANLLGKSARVAASLLEENSLRYAEDYTWMGSEAFLYYIDAPLIYLESERSRGDHDFAYAMIRTFRSRLQDDGAAPAAAIPAMRRFCQRTRADFDRLGFPTEYEGRLLRRIAELETEMHKVEQLGE